MKLYTMTLQLNPNHKLRSRWIFDRYWNITKVSQLESIIKKLNSWTKYDKQGRVLCIGFPAKDLSLQKRVYIVKMGHDKVLWHQQCEYYDELVSKLIAKIKV
jgi:DNA-binding transcriptional regulator/RsmH inhibitor MraZ